MLNRGSNTVSIIGNRKSKKEIGPEKKTVEGQCSVAQCTKHGVIGKIFFCQKIFGNSFSFQGTEQKWFLHQNGVEFNQKSKSDLNKLAGSWTGVGSPKYTEKTLIQLMSQQLPENPQLTTHISKLCCGIFFQVKSSCAV